MLERALWLQESTSAHRDELAAYNHSRRRSRLRALRHAFLRFVTLIGDFFAAGGPLSRRSSSLKLPVHLLLIRLDTSALQEEILRCRLGRPHPRKSLNKEVQ